MAKIRVDVNYTIKDGSKIVFRSPVDCSAITGLVVYYPAEDGTDTYKEFVLADAHGHDVGNIDHLFSENVIVKVILDVTAGMAYVQNADTNAYIERTFIKSFNGVKPDPETGNVAIDVKGNDGGVYIPTISMLSEDVVQIELLASDESMPGLSPVSIKLPTGPAGPQGEAGPPGEDGGCYSPRLEKNGEDVVVFKFMGSKEGMPDLPPIPVKLPAGPSGPQGEPGFSPRVSISKDDNVTTITITDAEGAQSAIILDGLPAPATAKPGQYISVTVDENGHVTGTVAVDPPAASGGGDALLTANAKLYLRALLSAATYDTSVLPNPSETIDKFFFELNKSTIADSFDQADWSNGFIDDYGNYREKDKVVGDMNMSGFIELQPTPDCYVVAKVTFDAWWNRVSYYDKNLTWISNSFHDSPNTRYVHPGPPTAAYYVLSCNATGVRSKVSEERTIYRYTDGNIFPADATWTDGSIVIANGGFATEYGCHFSSPFNVADYAGASILVVQREGVTSIDSLRIAFWDGDGNYISGTYGKDVLEYTIPENAVTAKIAKPMNSTVLILANETVICKASDLA